MIEGAYADETLHALAVIFRSANEFIVCGSRFFGDAKDSSDFDFVTDLDFDGMDWCLNNGWNVSKSDEIGYLDENTKHIIQRGKVHIIIAQSIERRIKARDYIVSNGLDRHKTESWDKAYNEIP